jgi:hypothetical protein
VCFRFLGGFVCCGLVDLVVLDAERRLEGGSCMICKFQAWETESSMPLLQ